MKKWNKYNNLTVFFNAFLLKNPVKTKAFSKYRGCCIVFSLVVAVICRTSPASLSVGVLWLQCWLFS
ncbi:hypothetical protein ACV2ER_05235 [Salmonella enterica subsp. enterica serovar Pomona]